MPRKSQSRSPGGGRTGDFRSFIRAPGVPELSSKMHHMAFSMASPAFGFTESCLSSMFLGVSPV